MKVRDVLSKLDLELSAEQGKKFTKAAKEMKDLILNEIKSKRIDAEVFLGGSFSRGTMLKTNNCDIDIFVRFSWKYEDLTEILGRIVSSLSKKHKIKSERIHGSRDYFRLIKDREIIFEIIPVLKIKSPKEARNVTDLSYFHVNYVKRRVDSKLAREILITKAFFKAAGVYGAESYVRGFSGYAIECLIIYFRSFEKLIKEIVKAKDKIIIDPEKKFKNKSEILLELNENKLNSPIVLVDPTWKERNVLAALSEETFQKIKSYSSDFLRSPSLKRFEVHGVNESDLSKLAESKKAEAIKITLKTEKQAGDIAGTKMKKFSKWLEKELEKYVTIIKTEFVYLQGKVSDFYIIAKKKDKIEKIGPPTNMETAALKFRKRNKKVFEKDGVLYSETYLTGNLKKVISDYLNKDKKRIKDMDISGLEIEELN